MSWWSAKVRRFIRYFVAGASAAERDDMVTWLTPAQLALFDSMHRADQRHGLDVVAALRRDGQTDPDLLLAGLVHDCGKGSELHVWHRVAWSLSERYGNVVERPALKLPGFTQAFATLADHAEISARLALAAGASAATADLIRNQAEPIDAELGFALFRADQAN